MKQIVQRQNLLRPVAETGPSGNLHVPAIQKSQLEHSVIQIHDLKNILKEKQLSQRRELTSDDDFR